MKETEKGDWDMKGVGEMKFRKPGNPEKNVETPTLSTTDTTTPASRFKLG